MEEFLNTKPRYGTLCEVTDIMMVGKDRDAWPYKVADVLVAAVGAYKDSGGITGVPDIATGS